MNRHGFRAPASMIEAVPTLGEFEFVAFPRRPDHRQVRPSSVWIETSRGRGTIRFRAMREELKDDALVILQDFLRANPEVRLTTAIVGRSHARLSQCYYLRAALKARLDHARWKYRGGRQILRLRDPEKAFDTYR